MNKTLPSNSLRVARRNPALSPFEYEIYVGGQEKPLLGYLTRRFDAEGKNPRDTLLVGSREASLTGPLAELDPLFADLRRHFIRLSLLGGKRLGAAKELVNEIKLQPDPHDTRAVAVHTFGPVPVVLGKLAEDEPVAPTVGGFRPQFLAFYPTTGEYSKRPLALLGTSSHEQFARCLRGRLATCFLRYCEDVAGYFDWIRTEITADQLFVAGRAAEGRIGASIRTKLLFVDEKQAAKFPANLRREVSALAGETHLTRVKASYARTVALFLLNEYYSHLGIRSQSKYGEELMSPPPELVGNAEEKWVEVIHGLVQQYRSGVSPSNWLPSTHASAQPYWVQSFANFIAFLGHLREQPAATDFSFQRFQAVCDRGSAARLKDFRSLFAASIPKTRAMELTKPPLIDCTPLPPAAEEAGNWSAQSIWAEPGYAAPHGSTRKVRSYPATREQLEGQMVDDRQERLRLWVIGMLRFCRFTARDIEFFEAIRPLIGEPAVKKLLEQDGARGRWSKSDMRAMLAILRSKTDERVFVHATGRFRLMDFLRSGRIVQSALDAEIFRQQGGLGPVRSAVIIDDACRFARENPPTWLWI